MWKARFAQGPVIKPRQKSRKGLFYWSNKCRILHRFGGREGVPVRFLFCPTLKPMAHLGASLDHNGPERLASSPCGETTAAFPPFRQSMSSASGRRQKKRRSVLLRGPSWKRHMEISGHVIGNFVCILFSATNLTRRIINWRLKANLVPRLSVFGKDRDPVEQGWWVVFCRWTDMLGLVSSC